MKDIDDYISRYCLPYSTQMKKLTEPLLRRYGIDMFLAGRFDQEGHYSLLSNAPKMTEYWHEREYYRCNSFYSAPRLFTTFSALASNLQDPNIQKEKEDMKKNCAMYSECIILKKPSPDVLLIFSFSSSLPCHKLLDIHHYTPYVFENFIDYFLDASTPFRKHSNDNAISILPYRGDAFYQRTKWLEPVAALERQNALFLSELRPQNTKLTAAERQCIDLYISGHTAAESAAKLKRSRRTIESHFGSILHKLELKSKRDLVRLKQQGLL